MTEEYCKISETAKRQIDSDFCSSCCHDYWVHKECLNEIDTNGI